MDEQLSRLWTGGRVSIKDGLAKVDQKIAKRHKPVYDRFATAKTIPLWNRNLPEVVSCVRPEHALEVTRRRAEPDREAIIRRRMAVCSNSRINIQRNRTSRSAHASQGGLCNGR